MSGEIRNWSSGARGKSPETRWVGATDAPLVWLELSRETDEVLAADVSGGLYLLDPQGRIAALTRGPAPLRAIAWSDTGSGGVALVGERKLYWFDRQLEFQGSVELPEPTLAVAIDSHGDYAAVSLTNGANLIFDGPRKPIHSFETMRPLVNLDFVVEHPQLVGIADYGLLCCHSFQGEVEWQEKLWGNAGDVALTGSGEMILVASFTHGIQRYDDEGQNVGSYQVEGTVSRVCTSYLPKRIGAATLERHLYWIDVSGEMIWAAMMNDDISRLCCDPLGRGLVCGFQSGRILRLEW